MEADKKAYLSASGVPGWVIGQIEREILAAQREAEKATIERCALAIVGSGWAKKVSALSSAYPEVSDAST